MLYILPLYAVVFLRFEQLVYEVSESDPPIEVCIEFEGADQVPDVEVFVDVATVPGTATGEQTLNSFKYGLQLMCSVQCSSYNSATL